MQTDESEDLEKYETEMELQLYREYRDVVGLFTHVVETERRFYLCNSVDVKVRGRRRRGLLRRHDARRVGVGHLPAGPVRQERSGCVTFKDVNIEELAKTDLELPKAGVHMP